MTNICQTLQALEEQLLDPSIRCDPQAVAALLTEDFREFGSSGRTFTKQEIIAELAAETPRRASQLTHFTCQQLALGVALITYRSTNAESTKTALRSSLWVFRDDRWQMLFHQGTRTDPSLVEP